MTFEPNKILNNVLEFYYSSGIINQESKPVQIIESKHIIVNGAPQKFEQLLFFLMGHLFPDFCPIKISFNVENLESSDNALLLTQFFLPPSSATSINQLRETIDADDRFRKLLSQAHSDCNDLPGSIDGCSRCIRLAYPTENIYAEETIPIIDFAELIERFDGDDSAFTLLEGFVMNARRHLLLLISATDKKEWNEAYRHSHALKGGALNICASPFATKAKAIEFSIKEGEYASLPSAIKQLEQACGELEAAWNGYREEKRG